MDNVITGDEKDRASGAYAPYEVKFINPSDLIRELGFKAGMKIADFGCATGYFTLPLARTVGNTGMVYALDILAEKLETVESQSKLSGLTNISLRRVNLEKAGGSKLESESVDWVLLVNMLFQNRDKELIVSEAKRVLKKGGNILVIEWNELDSSIGPEKSLRIPKTAMLDLAAKSELSVIREVAVSDFHYGLILEK